ncbi:MAG: hypothetical protein ACYC91_13445 [Solirubrobacteraceae bacterium]
MANAYEWTTVVVGVVAVAVCLAPIMRPGRALSDLGRQGVTWFEQPGERSIDELPSEDAVDDPLPHRELRGRP